MRKSEQLKKEFDISAIIVSYNPDYEKLMMTIRSFLLQEDVKLEIIITDDGSKIDYFNEISNYFNNIGFKDFKLIKNKENVGTVMNFLNGVRKARGEFIKDLSPGDYLIGSYILRDWIDEQALNGYVLMGAKYVCYSMEENKEKIGIVKAHPQIISSNKEKMIRNYILYDDIFLGAATLIKRDVACKYLELIAGKVKYAEDNIFRIMAYCGENIGFYSKETILYEIGTGISTSGSEIWKEKLKKDWKETDQIILQLENENPKLKKEFKKYYQIKNHNKENSGIIKRIRYLSLPGKLLFIIKIKIRPQYTSAYFPEEWISRLKLSQ